MSEVYYDHDNGEFQVLCGEDIEILDGKILDAIGSTTAMAFDSFELSPNSSIAIGSLDNDAFIENDLGELVPLEGEITVSIVERKFEEIDRIVVVAIKQKAHIKQKVLTHDFEDLHTMTEAFTTAPICERYILYHYGDGRYEAVVEQHDLLDEKGSMSTRKMTLYDSAEVWTQLDDALQRQEM